AAGETQRARPRNLPARPNGGPVHLVLLSRSADHQVEPAVIDLAPALGRDSPAGFAKLGLPGGIGPAGAERNLSRTDRRPPGLATHWPGGSRTGNRSGECLPGA